MEGRLPGCRARALLWQEEQPDVGPSGTSRTGHFLLSTDRGAAIRALDVMSPLQDRERPDWKMFAFADPRSESVRRGTGSPTAPYPRRSGLHFRDQPDVPGQSRQWLDAALATGSRAARQFLLRVTRSLRAGRWYRSLVLASGAPGPDENAVQTCTGRAPTPSARGRHDDRRRDAPSRETSNAVSGTGPRTIVGARMGPSTTVRPPSASEH